METLTGLLSAVVEIAKVSGLSVLGTLLFVGGVVSVDRYWNRREASHTAKEDRLDKSEQTFREALLRNLSDNSVDMARMRAALENSDKAHSQCRQELAVEREQRAALEARVKTLEFFNRGA